MTDEQIATLNRSAQAPARQARANALATMETNPAVFHALYQEDINASTLENDGGRWGVLNLAES